MNGVNISADDLRFRSSVKEGPILARGDGVPLGTRMKGPIRRAGVVIADRFYGISRNGRMTAKALKAIPSR